MLKFIHEAISLSVILTSTSQEQIIRQQDKNDSAEAPEEGQKNDSAGSFKQEHASFGQKRADALESLAERFIATVTLVTLLGFIRRKSRSSTTKEQSDDVLNKILAKSSISVGVVHYPPLLDFDENGKISGLYAVMMNSVAKKNRLKTIYKPLKWNDLRQSIESGDVDIVLCVFSTLERSSYSDFGAIMHNIDVGAISLDSNDKVINHKDLNRDDVQIAVTKEPKLNNFLK